MDIPTDADFSVSISAIGFQDGLLASYHRHESQFSTRYELALLDTATGTFRWTVSETQSAFQRGGAPLFSQDGSLVYVNYWDGRNVAYQTATGDVAWNTPATKLTWYAGFARSANGELLYGATYTGSCDDPSEPGVHAYNAVTGELVDRYNASTPCTCPVAPCNTAFAPVTVSSSNQVFFIDELDGMVQLNGNDLAAGYVDNTVFNPTFSQQGYYSPGLNSAESIVFGSVGNEVGSFATTGLGLSWQNSLVGGDSWASAPMVVGPSQGAASGECAAGIVSGTIRCFDTTSGVVAWEYVSSTFQYSVSFISDSLVVAFGTTSSSLPSVALLNTVVVPTMSPTTAPTSTATSEPTTAPTTEPTSEPSASPVQTSDPTASPSADVTPSPTGLPSAGTSVALAWCSFTAMVLGLVAVH